MFIAEECKSDGGLGRVVFIAHPNTSLPCFFAHPLLNFLSRFVLLTERLEKALASLIFPLFH